MSPDSRLFHDRRRSSHPEATVVDGSWDAVTTKHPCPVCGATATCQRHLSGHFSGPAHDQDFVCCARIPSDWPLTNGGWLHRLERDDP